ncbi:FabD/lysophospholipase-like protein [Aspergillus ruber CBS 135680]|uniref:FabD/lysophospholipase-like protein n=1 Tax=Aspergillus ruber (strain CBS 135680) TaxID=1388766 RepID=A0A017SCU2_ASPRC|nr:FabD/lysophospholipase-like protein [Aspergillus ruber CBS 135680]EYE94025.1 FabD/lysophospholipase-like protein [Aspergillus ruber CBS 135680]
MHGGELSPLDSRGLCLLSLDGGVRELSALYILKALMDRLNHERADRPPVKPCEVTGGLIAIMLGRLEMTVDECIDTWTGKIKLRFNAKKLEHAIKDAITSNGAKETDFLMTDFVCTIAHEMEEIARLRSYSLPHKRNIRATICQAALATSVATTFFDPVYIGARKFADRALGANNPVEQVEWEASDIWCSGTGDLKPLAKCFVSIWTGSPGKKAIEDNILKFLSGTLHLDEKRYFCFNVDQGLQNVGLAGYREQGEIEAATDDYLEHQAQEFRVRDCIQNLKFKESVYISDFV